MTEETPERVCGVLGCTEPAVARLYREECRRGRGGPRCEHCLVFDGGL